MELSANININITKYSWIFDLCPLLFMRNHVHGPIARKLYRVLSAPKRARNPMKQRCITIIFIWISCSTTCPPQFFFRSLPAFRRSKNVVFLSFFKKVGGWTSLYFENYLRLKPRPAFIYLTKVKALRKSKLLWRVQSKFPISHTQIIGMRFG